MSCGRWWTEGNNRFFGPTKFHVIHLCDEHSTRDFPQPHRLGGWLPDRRGLILICRLHNQNLLSIGHGLKRKQIRNVKYIKANS
jgi:hypothetical protein